MSARFIQPGRTIDYTPSAAVKAGDVVIIGELVGIASRDIEAGMLGAIDLEGVFEFPKDAKAISAGAKVYWSGTAATSAANDGNTGSPTAYTQIGHAVAAALAGDGVVRVKIG